MKSDGIISKLGIVSLLFKNILLFMVAISD